LRKICAEIIESVIVVLSQASEELKNNLLQEGVAPIYLE
jgi:hypothetical protein